MPDYSRKARVIIRDYVEQHGTLPTMDRIHLNFTGSHEGFTRWEHVENEYSQYEWTDSSFEEFVELCKNAVEEDRERISEAYLEISWPENISTEGITEELDSYGLTTDDRGDREGFEFRIRDDEKIPSTYFYTTRRVEISSEYEVSELSNEKLVNFVIDPEKKLMIIGETQVANVQKLMGVFNNETDLSVNVAGNLTLVPDAEHANNLVESFVETFNNPNSEA